MSEKANVHSRKWRELRMIVLARDAGICWLCGKPGADSADHVMPRARGGTNALSNLRAAHLYCNKRKFVSMPTRPLTSRVW